MKKIKNFCEDVVFWMGIIIVLPYYLFRGVGIGISTRVHYGAVIKAVDLPRSVIKQCCQDAVKSHMKNGKLSSNYEIAANFATRLVLAQVEADFKRMQDI